MTPAGLSRVGSLADPSRPARPRAARVRAPA